MLGTMACDVQEVRGELNTNSFPLESGMHFERSENRPLPEAKRFAEPFATLSRHTFTVYFRGKVCVKDPHRGAFAAGFGCGCCDNFPDESRNFKVQARCTARNALWQLRLESRNF